MLEIGFAKELITPRFGVPWYGYSTGVFGEFQKKYVGSSENLLCCITHSHAGAYLNDGFNHQPIKNGGGFLISYFLFVHAWYNWPIAYDSICIETWHVMELSYETLRNCFIGREVKHHDK